MDYYIDELYAGCVSELNTLYQLLEQDKDELSGCVGGELLDAYRKIQISFCSSLMEYKKICASFLMSDRKHI